jgi:hypothetical protein
VLDKISSRQQHELHRSQAGPNTGKGAPGNVSIALNNQIRNFAELLLLG